MSSQTNIPINSRSMNGIITISDGGGTTIENGAITTNNLTAPNVATLNENETITGLYTFNPNLPQSPVVPTLGDQLVNKTYVDGLGAGYVTIAGNQTLTTGIKTFTNLPECSTAATTANQLTNKTYVDTLDAQNVKLSGTQAITGLKTFNTNLPTSTIAATTANQLTNKTYVDTLDGNNVKLTGNQTIGGIKTFSSVPECSTAATTANQLTNKTYVDTLDAQNIKISGSQTFTTGVKTFTNLPLCSAVPSTSSELVNKAYADGVTSGFATLAGSQTFTTGVKTFTNLPECSAVPSTANQLTNKTYVDSNFVTLATTQSISGSKTFTSLLRVTNGGTDGYLYLGSGSNQLGIYQFSGFSYIESKNIINFYTNSTGGGSASRVEIGDGGLLINTGGNLILGNAGTTYINQTTNLMNFFVPTSAQFKWLVNSVQCGLLDAGGLTLKGALAVGNGENIQLNSAGSTIFSTATDMTYTATGASANHYFNIGASTIAGVNVNGLTIQDTKILQLGSTNTTNIQKVTASSRLDYNVPTGFKHSFRINGAEIVSVGSNRLTIGQNVLYMNSLDTAYLYTPSPDNITYLINDTATTGRISLRAGGASRPFFAVTSNGIEYGGTINSTYTSLPTLINASIGYIFNTAIANNILVAGGATTLLATISGLPIGVWAISYMCGFTSFVGLPQRQKIAVGTTTTGNQVMGDNLFQVSVNDYQSAMATIYFNNTSVQSIYLNDTENPGFSCRTYAPAGNAAFFQAIRIA